MADIDINVTRQTAVINIGGITTANAADVQVTDSGNLYGLGTPISVQQLADQVASLLALKAGGTVDNFSAIRYRTPIVALTPSDEIIWDASEGSLATLTIDQETNIGLTNEGVNSTFLTLIVTQDATGGHTLDFDQLEAVVLTDAVTTGANSVTVYSLVWSGSIYYGTGLTVVA